MRWKIQEFTGKCMEKLCISIMETGQQESWGIVLVDEALVMQAREPCSASMNLNAQHPCEKLSMITHSGKPSIGQR